MTHEELLDASEAIRAGADAATDEEIAGRLHEQADSLAALAERDPDHGRMARHENKLHALADEAGAEVAEAVDDALAHVRAYRETIEGV